MKKLGISGRTILAVILLATTIAATTLTALATFEYVKFYPSLEKIQLRLTVLEWTNDNRTIGTRAAFTVQNPTDYKGVSLRYHQSGLEIILNGSAGLHQVPLTTGHVIGPLVTNHPLNFSHPFVSTMDAARRFAETRNGGGDVMFVFNLELTLSTFLDRIATTFASYTCETRGEPVGCQQTLIRIIPNHELGPSGLGGGGGV